MLNETELLQLKNNGIALVMQSETPAELEELYIRLLGKKGELTTRIKDLKSLQPEDRARIGKVFNDVKNALEDVFKNKRAELGVRQRGRG